MNKTNYSKEELWNGFLVFYLLCIMLATLLISAELFIKATITGTLLCLGLVGILVLLGIIKGLIKLFREE